MGLCSWLNLAVGERSMSTLYKLLDELELAGSWGGVLGLAGGVE